MPVNYGKITPAQAFADMEKIDDTLWALIRMTAAGFNTHSLCKEFLAADPDVVDREEIHAVLDKILAREKTAASFGFRVN